MLPKVIGPYRVLDMLGSGGAGTVYRAVDRRNGDQVAVKLLATGKELDPQAVKRLAREFHALSTLSHPYVVKVFDTGTHDGLPYLSMELVEGLTLRQYLSLDTEDLMSGPVTRPPSMPRPLSLDGDSEDISSDGVASPFSLDAFSEESPSEELAGRSPLMRVPLSVPESDSRSSDSADSEDDFELPHEPDGLESPGPVERLEPGNLKDLNRPERVMRLKEAVLQLCEALSYIHGHGLVHRDLKPSNVMVDDERQVRLMDFGLAKFLADDAAVTLNGRRVGTFRYMAPEQILGEPLDARADLYSLGVVLYELLTGRPPFDAEAPYDLWQMVLETEPKAILALNRKADPQLARIAHRLLRKEPDDRYQTAEEVHEALSE